MHFKMIHYLCRIIFISILISIIKVYHADGDTLLNTKSDFSVNDDNRLSSNWLLQTDSSECKSLHIIENISKHRNLLGEVGILSSNYAVEFFDEVELSSDVCALACIDKGYHINYVNNLFLGKKIVIEKNDFNAQLLKVLEWLDSECLVKEIGFVSTMDNIVNLYWLDASSKERVLVGELGKGEQNQIWQDTVLGHEFEAVDSITEEVLGKYVITNDAWHVIGYTDSGIRKGYVEQGYTDNKAAIKELLNNEYYRSQSVKRTFTTVGFSKSKLPRDLFASMSAFYYNNRNNLKLEEWSDKGVFVNWWEQDSHMIVMPWGLKKYWQSRLKDLVETWSNTTLELTDIYGLRRYNEGARLLTHVDRTSTHAASLIINIAQGNVASPWPVEIYDHANRLHEIEMEEGDIVYYESAKCLHGRMRPLTGRGSYYVNLFSHYRPLNDPEWFQKPTPPDHAQPLIDINGIDIKKALPSLSSTKEQLQGPDDLFKWWKHVSPVKPYTKDEL